MEKMKLKDKINIFWLYKIYWPALAILKSIKNKILDKLGYEIIVPMFSNPLVAKWPVNAPCFCGSKKKAKKCCQPQLARNIVLKDYVFIKKRLALKGIIL